MKGVYIFIICFSSILHSCHWVTLQESKCLFGLLRQMLITDKLSEL